LTFLEELKKKLTNMPPKKKTKTVEEIQERIPVPNCESDETKPELPKSNNTQPESTNTHELENLISLDAPISHPELSVIPPSTSAETITTTTTSTSTASESTNNSDDDASTRKHKKKKKRGTGGNKPRNKSDRSSRPTSSNNNEDFSNSSSDEESASTSPAFGEGTSSDSYVQHWTLNPPAENETFPAVPKGQGFLGSTYGQGKWKYRKPGTQLWALHSTYPNAVYEYNYRRGVRQFKINMGGIDWEVSFDHRSERHVNDHNQKHVIQRD